MLNKIPAVIIDLDGTLCNTDHRLHFIEQKPKDYKSFYENLKYDVPNEWCLKILASLIEKGVFILFVSGRPEEYRYETIEWFNHNIQENFFDKNDACLFMRKNKDYRKDYTIKEEIYHTEIEPDFRVMMAFDDHKEVIDMWKENGINALWIANDKTDKSKGNVYLIRHGATDFNDGPERIRGWKDIPLNDHGRKQAQEAAKKLKGKGITEMYMSDLKRTKETADIIAKALKVKVNRTGNAFRPWHLGEFEGKSIKDVIKQINKLIDTEKKSPKEGESFAEFKDRYLHNLNLLIMMARHKGINIGVATHFRNLKAAVAWSKKGYPDDYSVDTAEMKKDDLEPGDVLVIKSTGEIEKL